MFTYVNIIIILVLIRNDTDHNKTVTMSNGINVLFTYNYPLIIIILIDRQTDRQTFIFKYLIKCLILFFCS